MTLEEAKDQVAKKLDYQNWDDMVESESDPSEIPYRVEEAAELYKNHHVQAMQEEIEKLKKFKAYVHKRLDDAGIPIDPESPHKEKGCRIGGRLDIVLKSTKPEGQ